MMIGVGARPDRIRRIGGTGWAGLGALWSGDDFAQDAGAGEDSQIVDTLISSCQLNPNHRWNEPAHGLECCVGTAV